MRLALLALAMFAGLVAAESKQPLPPAGQVVGVAEFDGGDRKAPVTWIYERDGERVESTVPPRRVAITRVAGNVEKMSIKFPQVTFAIKVETDAQRTFDKPLKMDTDQETFCSCSVRPDCRAGYKFSCQIEGILLDHVANAEK